MRQVRDQNTSPCHPVHPADKIMTRHEPTTLMLLNLSSTDNMPPSKPYPFSYYPINHPTRLPPLHQNHPAPLRPKPTLLLQQHKLRPPRPNNLNSHQQNLRIPHNHPNPPSPRSQPNQFPRPTGLRSRHRKGRRILLAILHRNSKPDGWTV